MLKGIKSVSIETRIILLLFSLTVLPAIVVGWISHDLLLNHIPTVRSEGTEWLTLDRIMFIVLAVSFLFAFLSALYLTIKISTPINNLIKTAHSIANGDYTSVANMRGKYGISELTAAFDFMTRQLITTKAQLEQKTAELGDQERLLRRIIDCDPNLIFIKNAEGRFLFANEAMAKTYGMTSEDMVGKRSADLVYCPGDAACYDQVNRQVLETFDEHAGIETAVLRDGSLHHFHTIRKPLIWKDSALTVLTVAMDVTELKRIEQNLLAVKNELSSTLDAIPDLLFEVGLDGRYYSYHSPRTDLLAAPPEVLMGKLLSEILPAQASAICLAALQEANEEGYSSGRQFKLQLGDELKWFELSITRKPTLEEGEPRFIVVSRDITRRKDAEQDMHTLYTAIDQSPISVIITDADARMQYINPYFEKKSGYSASEVLGRNPSMFKSEQTPMELYVEMWNTISNGKVWHGELINKDKSGQHYSEDTHIAPVMDETGKISQYVCLKIDNSERKHAERRLSESYQELQRLSSYLENLRENERAKIARDLHDEMGSLLVALKMRVAWLTSKLPAQSPQLVDEVGRISALVADAIRSVHEIVSELRPNLQEGFGFTATIDDYVKKFQQNTKIECSLLLPDEDLELNAQRRITLFRILQESLNNVALHAKASLAKICLMERDKSLFLTIEDNGIGFDTGMFKEHSFGLLGIRERALMIGGKARVTSARGKGTRVSVTVPLLESSRLE